MLLYKYSGAGNDFVVMDGRGCVDGLDRFRSPETISALCDRNTGFKAADGRIGADGLMILTDSSGVDFRMEYYNSDGSGGMMCGNGGRCIVAFADYLGVACSGPYVFEAADGLHTGEILSRNGEDKVVRLKMIDVQGITPVLNGWFLNTGTRHYVQLVPDVEAVDVEAEGRPIRWNPAFAPEGANVNFVSVDDAGTLHVRTFEKGVEAETLACGTGITASAIAAREAGIAALASADVEGRVKYPIRARKDDLSVDFIPASPAESVYLTGPACMVGEAENIDL